VRFSLSAGNAFDTKEGQLLLESIGKREGSYAVLVDRVYEDNKTRAFAEKHGFAPAEAQPQKAGGIMTLNCTRSATALNLSPPEGVPPRVYPLRQARCYVQRVYLSGCYQHCFAPL
jgi:hypothetical protein